MTITMIKLREALEASWDSKTSYQAVAENNNPALGQCYPTARVVQLFFPRTEIAEGEVWTGLRFEKHFWNLVEIEGSQYHIDLSWQQFPHGSVVQSFRIRDRHTLGDSQNTIDRIEVLHDRVKMYLANQSGSKKSIALVDSLTPNN